MFLAKKKCKRNEAPHHIDDENSLISTLHALNFLYEEALRSNHSYIACILKNTIYCCEEIIADRPGTTEKFKTSNYCLGLLKGFLRLSENERKSFVNVIGHLECLGL